MDYIEVPMIKKPVYGSFVYIRESYLLAAQKRQLPLHISCPTDSCIVTPEDWVDLGGKRIEKVFLRPDEPMVLWGNSIEKFSKKQTVQT